MRSVYLHFPDESEPRSYLFNGEVPQKGESLVCLAEGLELYVHSRSWVWEFATKGHGAPELELHLRHERDRPVG